MFPPEPQGLLPQRWSSSPVSRGHDQLILPIGEILNGHAHRLFGQNHILRLCVFRDVPGAFGDPDHHGVAAFFSLQLLNIRWSEHPAIPPKPFFSMRLYRIFLCIDDGVDPPDGLFHLIVEHHIIVTEGSGELPSRDLHPAADGLFVFCAAVPQPALEFFHRGNGDEDRYQVGPVVHDLLRPLHLDLQQHVLALGQPLFDGFLRRAIIMAIILGIFEQGIGGDHLLEFIRVGRNNERRPFPPDEAAWWLPRWTKPYPSGLKAGF